MNGIEIHPAIKEEAFRQQLRQIARMYGWSMQYHTYDSRRSDAGWPDEVFVHPEYGRMIFVEVKSEKGRVSGKQEVWLKALASCGAEAVVWRPSDIAEIMDVLGPKQTRLDTVKMRP